MLYSIIIKLKALSSATISPTQGYHAHALFLNIIRQADEKLSARLHDGVGIKPFTLSPLQGKFIRNSQGVQLAEGSVYWLRACLMDDNLFAAFMGFLLKQSSPVIVKLEEAPFKIEEIVTVKGQSPWSNCQSFEEILDNAANAREINLRFLSPTTFRSKGKRNVILPLPSLVFGSYLSRWKSLSPVDIDAGLEKYLENKVILGRYNLKSHILHFGSYQETGFEGTCTFLIEESVPAETVRALNALADFAFYCGTGAKTTMGMGQTRRLLDAGSLPRGAGLQSEKGRRDFPGNQR